MDEKIYGVLLEILEELKFLTLAKFLAVRCKFFHPLLHLFILV